MHFRFYYFREDSLNIDHVRNLKLFYIPYKNFHSFLMDCKQIFIIKFSLHKNGRYKPAVSQINSETVNLFKKYTIVVKSLL